MLECALARLVPHAVYFEGVPAEPGADEVLTVSRFAYLRCDRLASPRGYAHLIVLHDDALRIYRALGRGASLAQLAREFPGVRDLAPFVRLLLAAAIVDREPESDALRQWEFHDLLLHAESRLGRSMHPIGGTYRFVEELPPPPAHAERSWTGPRVELAMPARNDALADIIERRRTQREQGREPITVQQLGEFLHRTARVVSTSSAPWPREFPFGGDYTRRLYPNGGSRYELELYVTANRCAGLDRGFYHYDAEHHSLVMVSAPSTEMEQLLADGVRASGGHETQVLITIASRFQRSSWKYQSLALALQLKNLGVLFAHMYLVATALELAPCALGGGSSDLFARLAKLDYLVEGSIGEFMLGSKP